MICYHSINSADSMKGGSAVQQQNQQPSSTTKRRILFPQTDLDLVSKSLELSKFYVTKNSQLYQQPQDILQKINQALSIISSSSSSSSKSNNSKSNTTNNNSKNQNQSAATKGGGSLLDHNNNSNRYQNLKYP